MKTKTCPTCGADAMDRYCSQCGEQQLTHQDYSLLHYLKEAFHTLSDFDFKILRSLWILLRHPGRLSSDYLQGRRAPYLSPLKLFIFVSVIYYIGLSVLHSNPALSSTDVQFNTFTTPLAIQLHGNDFYPDYAAGRVKTAMQRHGIDYRTLEAKYDESTVVFSKTLVFALIPIIALLFYGFFFRKRKYFVQHLIIATHFWSFALVLIGVLLPAAALTLGYSMDAAGFSKSIVLNDSVLSYTLQIVFAVYLFVMLRRVYDASAWYSGLIAVGLSWSFFFIVWLFRFFLFEVTLAAIARTGMAGAAG